MRFVLAALAAFVCVVWGGSPLSQTLTAQAEETIRPAPASASELLGSRWNLHIQRTDKETWNSRPYSYDLTVVFLPEGEVIMWGPEINESGRWKVSGKQVTIENDINTKFSFNFADGKTSGTGGSTGALPADDDEAADEDDEAEIEIADEVDDD